MNIDKCCKPEWNGRCCCNCKFRLTDYSHPCTDGHSVLQQRGWICAPEPDHSFSGWTEHGLCEMHMLKPGMEGFETK